MNKIRGTFVLCCFAIFNVPNAVESRNFSGFVLAGDATDDDVKLINSITPKETLPIILFGEKLTTKLQNPLGLSRVKINKEGRLAPGTEFYTMPSLPQIFFCPDTDPEQTENCLVPTEFEKSSALQCVLEPTPILERNPRSNSCAPGGTGINLRSAYKICPRTMSTPYSYHSNRLVIYLACYDEDLKKILSVSYKILGAGMISEKLLIREREVEFDLNTKTYGLIADDYLVTLTAKTESKPQYTLQKLVPTDDMALASWRKATYHFANFELQHKDLIEPWDYVRSLIRAHAEKSFDQSFDIVTGVFEIPKDEVSTSVDENQIANFWATLIIYSTKNSNTALAVIANNFMARQSNNQDDDTRISENDQDDHIKTFENNQSVQSETLEQQYIDKICGQDLCVDSLRRKFGKVGGQIRCCKVNENIINLFISEDVLPPDNTLRITGINNVY